MTTATMVMIGYGSMYAIGFVFCVAFVLYAWRRRHLRHGLPLPPGPTGLPLVGNIFNINSAQPWLSYEQWGKQYGDLIYVNLLCKDFIIINSARVAHDLLDLRSAVYSERPYLQPIKFVGADFSSAGLPYGNKWRLHRKVYNTVFSKKKVGQYKPIAIRKARKLVENLLDSPEDYAEHCKMFATVIIMAATYGYEVVTMNDQFVSKTWRFIDLCDAVLTPERVALLLTFPFLEHVPSWFPGGQYKQQSEESRALAKEVLATPVEYVMESMAAGTAGQSLVRDLIETKDDKVDQDTIRAVAASTLMAGIYSTSSTLQVFLLAMVLHPEVQEKAREEIHRVVGNGRLPDFDDRPDLPYVEAVYLETLRWRSVVPSGISHMTMTSDVYKGMYIPKGAIVIPNIWAIALDETQFDNSMAFIPDRHLTSTGRLTEGTNNYAFGFGRRICAGRHFADQNVWAAVVTTLAIVHLSKAHEKFGNEIDVKADFMGDVIIAPKPFVYSITPNSEYAEKLV